MDWLTQLETPATALAVLTAMLTPAVLISACGALIFSTGARLGRVIDRLRALTVRVEQLARNPEADEFAAERRALLYNQVERQTARARLIQRAMVAFYTAVGVFVATSVAIALTNAVARQYTWIVVVLGLLGAICMLVGSVLLIIESRVALAAILSETEFAAKVSRHYSGEEKSDPAAASRFPWFSRKIG